MHSHLIATSDFQKAKDFIQKQCDQLSIAPIDIFLIDLTEEEKKPKLSIGIEDIRKIQRNAYFKPVQSTHKAIIIGQGDKMTPEAQNAFLKILEEPPTHILFFIITQNLYDMLPTIQSRCTIIQLAHVNKNTQQPPSQIDIVHTSSIGKKLTLAHQFGSDKNRTLQWLEDIMESMHSSLHSSIQSKELSNIRLLSHALHSLQKTHTIVKTTNVSPKFALEILLLNL